jgi:predicted MFS family arabinose efflux permease
MKKYLAKWNAADKNLRCFLIGVLLVGINGGILAASFNNYLNDIFSMSEKARGALEFPREFPGFLLIAVTGLLAGHSLRMWAMLVGVLSGIGIFGLGFFSPSAYIMSVWMVLWSMSDHLFMPVESTMGLYLAKEGKQGKRLGQISGARNLSMIFGALTVYAVSLFLSGKALYMSIFAVATCTALASLFVFKNMNVPSDIKGSKKRFVIRKEYSVYYVLNILFGARKQIFLTFAPWVLVTKFDTSPSTMAVLIMIASLAGVLFRQAFGVFTDRFGEKKMFIADALILLGICAGFAFLKNVYILYTIYIIDNLMFASRIARTTYLNKIALSKADIPATISLGITMDHVVSMTVPFFGGLLWAAKGYSYVFIAASIVAFVGLILSLNIRVPKKSLHI